MEKVVMTVTSNLLPVTCSRAVECKLNTLDGEIAFVGVMTDVDWQNLLAVSNDKEIVVKVVPLGG